MPEPAVAEQPIVVVDIDGVLFDTPIDAVTSANAANGTNHDVTDIFNYNAEHDRGKFVVNGVDQFHKYQLDTASYRQVDGAKEAIEHLVRQTGAKVIALTSRNYDLFYEPTKAAISEHFGDLISEVYFTTEPSNDIHREKGEIVKELGGKVLLDDAVKYCESAVNHGLPAVLIPQPYNRTGHNYPPEYTAIDWQDAVRIVEQELEKTGATTMPNNSETVEVKLEDEGLEFAQGLVRKAGELIRSSLTAGDYTSAWKEDNTPVTSVDIAVNRMVIEELSRQFPNDRVYGEEQSAEAEGGLTWILDPIDGTQALEQEDYAAVTVCLARLDSEGKPLFGLVYNPEKERLFAAVRGEAATMNGEPIHVSDKDQIKSSYIYLGSRIYGEGLVENSELYKRFEGAGAKVLNRRALAFHCTQVAQGKADGAYIGVKTPFEAAAIQLIVEGAGGTVTDLYGQAPGRMDGEIRGLVASNGKIHGQLLEALQP